MYKQGYKLQKERNYTEAIPLLNQAAEQGHIGAQYSLAFIHMNVTQDYAQVVKWYLKIAEREDDALVQYVLGSMYQYGKGVQKNYTQAAEWYRKAAKRGKSEAQLELGLLYKNGQGVKQDYKQAVAWIRKAAEQDDITATEAQVALGKMYYKGDGALEDYTKAAKWYRKAAEQGHVQALNALGIMHEKGYGVKKNLSLAYALFILSAKYDEEGKKLAKNAREKMTAEQIMAGQKIAKEWDQRIEANF